MRVIASFPLGGLPLTGKRFLSRVLFFSLCHVTCRRERARPADGKQWRLPGWDSPRGLRARTANGHPVCSGTGFLCQTIQVFAPQPRQCTQDTRHSVRSDLESHGTQVARAAALVFIANPPRPSFSGRAAPNSLANDSAPFALLGGTMAERPPVLHIATAGLNEPVASSSSGSVNVDSRFDRTPADRPASLPRSLSLNSKTRRRDTVTDQDRLHPWTAALKRSASSKRGRANTSTTSLASSATSHSEYATDSAYGTLDEYDDSPGEDADETEGFDGPQWASRSAPGWRDRVERSFQYRAQRRVQAVLDEEEWSRRVERATLSARWQSSDSDTGFVDGALASGHGTQTSHDQPSGFGGFHLAQRVGAFYGSSDSLASSPTSPSTPSSRSSPEPSEYGDADAAAAASATRLVMRSPRQRLPSFADSSLTSQPTTLSRRHTLPRRRASRSRPSPTKGACDAPAHRDTPSRASGDLASRPHGPFAADVPRRHQLASAASLATLAVSFASTLSTAFRVVPISPVHLRNSPSAAALAVEIGNAALAPFLALPTLPSGVLVGANLYLLAQLEQQTNVRSFRRRLVVGVALWCAIVLLRASLSHVLGRLVGWAHPQLLSTSAIHEVGYGAFFRTFAGFGFWQERADMPLLTNRSYPDSARLGDDDRHP